ncbi:hypothetical protein ACP70R_042491 [Stipagrostis hirtigluma subsp. patula]
MNMASAGYYPSYYQPAPYYYYNYPQYHHQRARGGGGGARSSSSSSVAVFLLLATVSFLVATSLYALCESAVESLVDQLRRFLILSPLLLILAVQFWVASGGGGGGGGLMSLLAELVMGDQRGQYHGYGGRGGAGAGSPPWGVALALVVVLFLVSYQSSFQERWFPLFGR